MGLRSRSKRLRLDVKENLKVDASSSVPSEDDSPPQKTRVHIRPLKPRRIVERDNGEESEDETLPKLDVDDEWIQIEEEAKTQNEKRFKKETEGMISEQNISEEERFDKLMDLLGKSKFYADHLKNKLREDNSKKLKEEMLKNRKSTVLQSLNNSKKRKFVDEDTAPKKHRLFEGKEIPDDQPLLVKGGIMRDYQIKGFQWMCSLWENGINGILADEMGLGKTIQTISLFAHLIEMGVEGPFLVVAPLSTLGNWVNEFKRFTPDIPVVLFHGNLEKRKELFRRLKDVAHVTGIRGGIKSVFVTSYEIILNSRKLFKNMNWKYIVVDEGHRLKNFKCRLIKELKMYHTANKLLLTGTPLQNNMAELWSLLNFLMPEIFNDLNMFQSWFSVEKIQANENDSISMSERETKVLTTLHQILSPFLLRRIKSDIELKIPPKKEVLVYCPMTAYQTNLYKATINKTLKTLLEDSETSDSSSKEDLIRSNRRPKKMYYSELNDASIDDTINRRNEAMVWKNGIDVSTGCQRNAPRNAVLNFSNKNITMDLRKITNHPYLIEYPLSEDGNFYRSDKDMIDACGKLKVLDQLLNELIVKRNHKVLIFSQMTKMLDILEDYLQLQGFSHVRLDGSMKLEERQENIHNFSSSSDLNIFLLSTRAGGLGINLTAADTVIIYDSDWNPQQDLQAQDRCHRIGQTRPVMIYRLVTANTIDERIVQIASSKRRLEKMVIHEKEFKSVEYDTNLFNLTRKDLVGLLRHCDHSGIVDRKDGAIFTPEELGVLMNRSNMYSTSTTSSLKNGHAFKLVDSSTSETLLSSICSKENSQ
ncbi:lymphoid-specific helicase [Lepeophtheirus salmonis]|uniref:lymphoid-specific helicase n=1 Tax=Lepeophtheirus salmonis TaxID=72036 RepID=UPI001AE2B0D4|nr:lymphoid-specific helicase-like [Lepeophtheirus salmonis]